MNIPQKYNYDYQDAFHYFRAKDLIILEEVT